MSAGGGPLEGRWTVSILWASHDGASRFNEFKQAVGEIPPRTLAQRLVELEEAGVLERRVIDARPPRVEYTLTPKGRRLQAVLDALAIYAATRARLLPDPAVDLRRQPDVGVAPGLDDCHLADLACVYVGL